MGRIRTVKPELFLDEELGVLSGDHVALFVGLLTLADKEGRLENRPVRIKAALFPYRAVDVVALIGDLEEIGKVGRYEIPGGEALVIWNFPKHQRCHPKEAASIIPPPPSREISRRAGKGLACIPSSPGGREGKGREGDLGREPEAAPQKNSIVPEVGQTPGSQAPAPAPETVTEPTFKRPVGDIVAAVEALYLAATGEPFAWDAHPNGPEERALRALEAQHGERLPELLRVAFEPSWPAHASLARLHRGGAGAINELRQKAARLKASKPAALTAGATTSAGACAICGTSSIGQFWGQPLCGSHGGEFHADPQHPTTEADAARWVETRRGETAA